MKSKAYSFEPLRNTLVAVWSGDPDCPSLIELVERLRDLHAENPSGIFLYNVITPSTGMPDREARDLLRDHFASMRGKLLAAAMVVEKPGVEGSLSRAVLSTLLIMSGRPFPMRIFAKRKDAAEWLASQAGAPPAVQLSARAEVLAGRLL